MEGKKKENIGLIILVVILLIACIGMGAFIFVNKDKLIVKTSKEETEKAKNQEIDKQDEEDVEEPTVAPVDDSKFTEKVYGSENHTIILFKSGKCVLKSGSEYSTHCTYSIENNTITLISFSPGASSGIEDTYIYNIIQDETNNEEYIELSTDPRQRHKYFR